MDDDDDGPPMLVDAEGNEADEATLATDMKEAKVSKVPISIITGKYLRPPSLVLRFAVSFHVSSMP